ncbi:hypothetical protein P7C71_g6245, partial [Lecanoromycetidae sp. Uapishka_2]
MMTPGSIAGPDTNGIMSAPSNSPATVEQPSKKSKLTFAEKETRRIEKEFKDREKAEEKVRKELEKAKRDEEKAKKDAEKEVEKARREEEKKLKEAEKEEKRLAKEEKLRLKQEEKARRQVEAEEEKTKEARKQTRLHKFFPAPSMPNISSLGSPMRDSPSPSSSRRSSVAEIKAIEDAEVRRRSRSVSCTPQKSLLPDYERCFLPFPVKDNLIMAPPHQFSRDKGGHDYAEAKIDASLKVKVEGDDGSGKDTRTFDFLMFYQDVRPPYIGTYTRLQDGRSISQIARDPFSRTLPATNYDDDSEGEWEEPEEGEDLDSEGEEELGDDEDEGEMEGFLDDEEAADARAIKRRPVLGDMEPICTGVCWEGPKYPTCQDEDFALDLSKVKLDILMEHPQLPIDPYSTIYWQSTASDTPLKPSISAQSSLMDPPRIPLNPVNRQNTLLPPSSTLSFTDPSGPAKPKRLIALELMDEFRAEVDGNDLTKVGLLEILKKKFPKMPKDAIKETLDLVAERVGQKVSEK